MVVAPIAVRDAQRGLPGAEHVLLEQVAPIVLGWCLRLGGPSVDAHDAAQDVLEILVRRLADVREADAFQSWMFGITRRVLSRHRRRAWIRRWLPGLAVPDRPDPSASPEQRAADAELADAIDRAIAALPLHHREVVVLCDVEERADTEVAAMLGVPRNTVKSRLRRAREQLQVALADQAAAIRWPEEP